MYGVVTLSLDALIVPYETPPFRMGGAEGDHLYLSWEGEAPTNVRTFPMADPVTG